MLSQREGGGWGGGGVEGKAISGRFLTSHVSQYHAFHFSYIFLKMYQSFLALYVLRNSRLVICMRGRLAESRPASLCDRLRSIDPSSCSSSVSCRISRQNRVAI